MSIINKVQEKISGEWIFLIIVIVLYLIVMIVDPISAEITLFKFVALIKKIIPVLALVFALMFISNLYLDTKKINGLVGENAGIKGWIAGVAGGILSTGPIYMWYPLLSDLKAKGMKDGLISTFLYSRAVKIPMMPIMIYYFGLSFTVIITFYMIVFSIINGVLVEKFLKQKQ